MTDLDIPVFPDKLTDPQVYQALEQALHILEIDQTMVARTVMDYLETHGEVDREDYQIAVQAYHCNARAIAALKLIIRELP